MYTTDDVNFKHAAFLENEPEYDGVHVIESDGSGLDDPEFYDHENGDAVGRVEIDDPEIDDGVNSGGDNYDMNDHMEDALSPEENPRGMFAGPVFETREDICGGGREFPEIYFAAISCGTAEEVHQLLSVPGFQVNHEPHEEVPQLLQSLARGHMAEGVFVVLAAKADPNAKDVSTGNSALHDTILNMAHGLHVDPNCGIEGLAVVHLLLCYGANVHDVNDNGNTALHLAVLSGQPSVVELLLDQGAYEDLFIQDVNEATPRDYARELVIGRRNASGTEESSLLDLMAQYEAVESIIIEAEAYEQKIQELHAGQDGTIESMLKPSRLLQTPRQVFSMLSRADLLVPYDQRWMYANQVDVGGSLLMKTIVDEERRVASRK